MNELGMLYSCDKQGNNAEPLNAGGAPYTIDEADFCDVGDSATIRRATVCDDCGLSVTHVAIDNESGSICGYYKFA